MYTERSSWHIHWVWAPFIECVKNGKGEGEGTNTGYVHIWMYVYVYMTENDLQEIKL